MWFCGCNKLTGSAFVSRRFTSSRDWRCPVNQEPIPAAEAFPPRHWYIESAACGLVSHDAPSLVAEGNSAQSNPASRAGRVAWQSHAIRPTCAPCLSIFDLSHAEANWRFRPVCEGRERPLSDRPSRRLRSIILRRQER